MLRRPDSVEELAGVAPPPPFLRAVQLTSVNDCVTCAHDVVVVMQQALYECTLLASQESLVPNSACLRVALLHHVLTAVIPLPLPLDHEERHTRCFWASERIRYETQAQLLRLLALLEQHHAAASLCLELTRELDAARIVATACTATIADAVMRTRAVDTPSVLSDHYAGRVGGPTSPFGVDHHPFAAESETLKFTEPHLLIARGMVLDYFASVRRIVPLENRLFCWEQPAEFGEGELRLVSQICAQVGLSRHAHLAVADPPSSGAELVEGDDSALPLYLTGELPDILLLFPELAAFRDLLFLFKLFMCPDQAMLPARARWRPADAKLTWRHHREEKRSKKESPAALMVSGFGSSHLNLGLARALRGSDGSWHAADVIRETLTKLGFNVARNNAQGALKPRAPPSGANPSALLRNPKLSISTEDDVLAIDSQLLLDMQRTVDTNGNETLLGSSEGNNDARPPLSARDAELLLTYLTAPYIRIPLLLHFFADQQRLNALSSSRMQEILEAALFEPGAWQEEEYRQPPTQLPPSADERSKLLATPLGLLFNELVHSPSLLLEPLERLLETALDLDTGAHTGSTARIVYFVIRLIVRVESYALLLVRHARWKGASCPSKTDCGTGVGITNQGYSAICKAAVATSASFFGLSSDLFSASSHSTSASTTCASCYL